MQSGLRLGRAAWTRWCVHGRGTIYLVHSSSFLLRSSGGITQRGGDHHERWGNDSSKDDCHAACGQDACGALEIAG